MSHPQQREFCRAVRRKHPKYFNGTFVIDVGSLDINGSNRELFFGWNRSCNYVGIDIVKGKNVNFVGYAHELLPTIRQTLSEYSNSRYRIKDASFSGWPQIDVVVSTEMLEHSKTWDLDLQEMYKVLRPGGLLLITAAGAGRPEHGTTKCSPGDSPGTNDYYKNISNEMFASVLPPSLFKEYYINQDDSNKDLQFYGIKQ